MFYDKPIFFEQNRVYRVYTGGKLFAGFFGDSSEDSFYPEEWVASPVKAMNKNSSGPKEGVSKLQGADLYFDDALKTYKQEMLGSRNDLGFLVKVLDSGIRLPVQAHPTKEFSRKYFHSEYGKAESWVILGLRENAKLYFGFQDGVTIEEFKAAVEKSEYDKEAMVGLIREVNVEKGDVLFIPAGAVHAIGYGCLILEVQEPTDFTIQPERWCGDVKLSDYEMYLGIDKETAFTCFDFEHKVQGKVKAQIIEKTEQFQYESLIGKQQTDCFRVNRINAGGTISLKEPASVYVVTDGNGVLSGQDYERNLKKGDYFFLPYNAAGKFSLSGNPSIEVIECCK